MSRVNLLVCDACGTTIADAEPRVSVIARVRSLDLELHYHDAGCWRDVLRSLRPHVAAANI